MGRQVKAKNPFYQFITSDKNKRDLNLKCRQGLKNAELDKIVLFCYNKVKYQTVKYLEIAMEREKVRMYVNRYCKLRDIQFAAYEMYARKYGLTAKELFVLDIIWFSEDGCLQSEICERLSASKQTVSAIIKKFWIQDYISLTESKDDRRNKVVRLTDSGIRYVKEIIPPAAEAEVDAMCRLSDSDIAELLRITAKFSDYMKNSFEKIKEV